MTDRLADLTARQLQDAQSVDFARFAQCAYHANSQGRTIALFREHYGRSFSLSLVEKAAVGAGGTVDPTWAGNLVTPRPLVDAFLGLVRPLEVLGQLQGTMTVPWATPVPVYAPAAQSATAWVGQDAPKPVTDFHFDTATLPPGKVALITTVTAELLKVATGAERALRDLLAEQIITEVNRSLLDPTRGPVVGEFPGSITSAGTAVTTTDDVLQDATAVLAALVAARPNVRYPTLILSPDAALQFPTDTGAVRLAPGGGVVVGLLPVTTIITGAAGLTITAIDPAAILMHDDGLAIDLSKHASIVMDSDPGTGAAQIVTSFWGQNLVGFRGERFVSWKLTDPAAVQYATRTPAAIRNGTH